MTPMKNRHWQTALLSLLVVFSAAVFLPGSSGPFIFDDYGNLFDNSYVKVTTLDAEALRHAAYSLEAGPFRRPVAMISFALNYYWAGGFGDSTPYKLTNIAIHAVNGLLILWFVHLILARLVETRAIPGVRLSARATTLLATAAAVLWVVHPIQVASVLYVVQRMTELSALFTLLAIVCYLMARRALQSGRRWAPWLLVGGPVLFGALGALSKENALLLPLFIGTLEFVLYPSERPWSFWRQLASKNRRAIGAALAAAAIAATVGAILYALPSYSERQFTMCERVLTEARVLFFYLSLIFVPRIDRFGHLHDDIALSTSLISPWTTIPALAGHAIILTGALLIRRRQPLVTLGVLWFYIAHLLESTIFGLEIAFEHRNYLAVLGPVLVIIGLLESARAGAWRHVRWLIPVIAIIFGGITALRASQWGDVISFYRYEVLHHPDSPRTQIGLNMLLEAQGRHEEAMQAIRRAVELDPNEAGYRLQLHLTEARQGKLLSPEEQQRTVEMLRSGSLSATAVTSLRHTSGCIQTWCQSLQVPLENWVKAVLGRGKRTPYDKSYFYYLLGLSYGAQGKIQESIEQFRLSYESDKAFLHPLFALADIYMQLGQIENARQVLTELQRANARSRYPRDRDLARLEQDVEARRVAPHRPAAPASR